MVNICFFNHFHNGDCFASKQFMLDLYHKVPGTYSYTHFNHPSILCDLPFPYVKMPDVISTVKNQWPPSSTSLAEFLVHNETIYINTWIGCYIDTVNSTKKKGIITDISDINWLSYYRMWQVIYGVVSKIVERPIELQSVSEYIPSISYEKFNVEKFHNFITKRESKKKVLVSNGKVLSCQSLMNHNMAHLIQELAQKFPDIDFICTDVFEADAANIFFTDFIHTRNGSDLNEISFLSTFCDAIVGRNSGAFLFTNTKHNLSTKKFLAFGRDERECFPYGLNFKNFVFVRDENDEVMRNALHLLVKSIEHD